MAIETTWALNDQTKEMLGSTIADHVVLLAKEQVPDLADLFPFKQSYQASTYFTDGWLAVQVAERTGPGLVPIVGTLPAEAVSKLKAVLGAFVPRSHRELCELLGRDWFSTERFTYVGPYVSGKASWPDIQEHIVEWLNHLVVPKISALNRQRIERAIPIPPHYDINAIRNALWVLESKEAMSQGTAFALRGVGLVTCDHVLGADTVAFRATDWRETYPVRVVAREGTIDLSVLAVDADLGPMLEAGSADGVQLMDHVLVAGFPNYRYGDSGVITPGLIIGTRMRSAIRRLLTNAPIVAGTSGGPALSRDSVVIGIAATGTDRMDNAQDTEDHGIIPVDALRFLAIKP